MSKIDELFAKVTEKYRYAKGEARTAYRNVLDMICECEKDELNANANSFLKLKNIINDNPDLPVIFVSEATGKQEFPGKIAWRDFDVFIKEAAFYKGLFYDNEWEFSMAILCHNPGLLDEYKVNFDIPFSSQSEETQENSEKLKDYIQQLYEQYFKKSIIVFLKHTTDATEKEQTDEMHKLSES